MGMTATEAKELLQKIRIIRPYRSLRRKQINVILDAALEEMNWFERQVIKQLAEKISRSKDYSYYGALELLSGLGMELIGHEIKDCDNKPAGFAGLVRRSRAGQGYNRG